MAGSQSYRIVGEKCHEQGRDCGGNRSCGEHAGAVHSGCCQHTRVDGQNVDHVQERGRAGDDFRLYVGAVFLQLEKFLHFVRFSF